MQQPWLHQFRYHQQHSNLHVAAAQLLASTVCTATSAASFSPPLQQQHHNLREPERHRVAPTGAAAIAAAPRSQGRRKGQKP